MEELLQHTYRLLLQNIGLCRHKLSLDKNCLLLVLY